MSELIIKLEGTDKLAIVYGKLGRDITIKVNQVIRQWTKDRFNETGVAVVVNVEKSSNIWLVNFS